MKKPKLTPWFNIAKHGQPVRRGFYEVRYGFMKNEEPCSRHWDGVAWSVSGKCGSCMFGNVPSDFPSESWRGLASDPSVQP